MPGRKRRKRVTKGDLISEILDLLIKHEYIKPKERDDFFYNLMLVNAETLRTIFVITKELDLYKGYTKLNHKLIKQQYQALPEEMKF